MAYYTDTPDTIIAQLTLEGRNTLARIKAGEIVYKHLGWQMGRGGYLYDNPVKTSPFIDLGAEAAGSVQVVSNTWANGTQLILNGKTFTYNDSGLEEFTAGPTVAATVQNIQAAISDSRDYRVFRKITATIDPLDPSVINIDSLITGDTGNTYILDEFQIGPNNFVLTPMAGGTSATLEDPAYPVPLTSLAPYVYPDGIIEWPTTTSLSFLSRIGEGLTGLGAYGEAGLWVEILDSNYPAEIGRKLLFAYAHFPIQPKTDRTLLTFRLIISF